MALKAITRRSPKTVVKTLTDLLAQVFTEYYKKKFYPEYFQMEGSTLVYDPQDVELKDGDYTSILEFAPPFENYSSRYCCGLLEIGEFDQYPPHKDPTVSGAIMRVFMANINETYNMVLATTIKNQTPANKYLEQSGFVPVADYKSKTTGNNITVLLRDFTSGEKELPLGDLEFDYEYGDN